MRKYFDLNDRAQRALKNNGDAALFPETGNCCNPDSVEQEKGSAISVTHQLVMYIGTFSGVLLSTAVTHFRSGTLELTITMGEVALSAVIALVIIPLVYEKLMLNPRAPLIVQFGLFVQNGVFWHVLIDSIGSIL